MFCFTAVSFQRTPVERRQSEWVKSRKRRSKVKPNNMWPYQTSQFCLHWLILITPFYAEKYSVELRACHKVINICKMWSEHKQMCLLLAVTKKKESYYFRSYNSRLKKWQLCSFFFHVASLINLDPDTPLSPQLSTEWRTDTTKQFVCTSFYNAQFVFLLPNKSCFRTILHHSIWKP